MTRPHVAMQARITLTVPEKTAELFRSGDNLNIDIGGFEFSCNGKPVQFDFDAAGFSIESQQDQPDGTAVITLAYQSGYGPFFNEDATAEYYDEEWLKLGLAPSDVTAEFLANADKAIEFHIGLGDDNVVDVHNIRVDNIIFTDGNSKFPAKMAAFNVTMPECTCD